MSVTLTGHVSFRSSVRPGGPPGERDVIQLNPQRRDKILRIAGWTELEPGTLNVDLDGSQFDLLTPEAATWIEDGASVVYPPLYQHIPRKREAYFYYRGTLHIRGKTRPVVVRRAKVPGPIRVEVYAAENLSRSLGLTSGDAVALEIRSAPIGT